MLDSGISHGSLLAINVKIVLCPPLNRITLGQHISDNYNRVGVQHGTSNILLQYSADSINRNPIKRRAL